MRLDDAAPAGRVQVRVARSLAELEPHRAAWDALAAAAPQQLPMLSHAWLSAYFEHMCPREDRWACVFVYRDADLLAMLPVVVARRRRFGWPVTVLTTPRDAHTQVGDLLAGPHDAAAAALALEQAHREFPEASVLEVNRFSDASPLLGWLRLRRLGQCYRLQVDSRGAYLPVPPDYAEFRRTLGRSFRKNLTYAANKAAQVKEVGYQFVNGSDARCEDLEALMTVEASGWKGAAGTAIAASPRLVAFYTALVRRLHEAGWLEWHFMRGDGQVLAGNLAIRMPHSVILWKLGYNDAYARCSPGAMLMEALLKRASADRSPAIVDMTTDEAWFDNWGMLRRLFYSVRFYFGAKGFLLGYVPDTIVALLRRCPPIVALKNALVRLAPRHA